MILVIENVCELFFAQVARHSFELVDRLLCWTCEHIAFLAAQLFTSRTLCLGVFVDPLSKILLLVNKVASSLLRLSSRGLRSRLDFLECCASLLLSCAL